MRHFSLIFSFFCLSLLLWGCGEAKIETLESSSPEGNRKITVTGSQEASMDPINVKVAVEVAKGTEEFGFQYQSNEMTKETVTFNWKDNGYCSITFSMADGDNWVVDIAMKDDEVRSKKRLETDGPFSFD